MPKMRAKVLGKVRELVITSQQHAQLLEYATGSGELEELCQRLADNVVVRDDVLVARVYSADMGRIRKLVERPDSGVWQELFRAIVKANTP